MKTPVSRVGNKSSILHILYAVFPPQYGRFVDVFGGSGSVLLGKPEVHPFEVYNDFDRIRASKTPKLSFAATNKKSDNLLIIAVR